MGQKREGAALEQPEREKKRKKKGGKDRTVHEKIRNLTNRPSTDKTPAYIFKISHTTFLTNPVAYSEQIVL